MTRIFVPRDAAARAVGADRVATAIAQETRRLGLAVDVVRTGSRGLFWLEPMIEVETPGGRIAFGPMTVKDVPGLFAGGLPPSAAHPLCVGRPEDIPFLKRQTRITFARCGIVDPLSLADYRAHGGYRGLERARSLGAAGTVDEVVRSGLRGRGGAGFPTGIKWKTVADTAADRKFIVCNADEGDSGTYADRMIMEGDPFLLIEGMTIAGFATIQGPPTLKMLDAVSSFIGDWKTPKGPLTLGLKPASKAGLEDLDKIMKPNALVELFGFSATYPGTRPGAAKAGPGK